MLDVLIPEKEFSETNYKRLEKSLVYKKNSINFDDGMYLTVSLSKNISIN